MIESCSFKRMLISLVVLIGISVLILLIEIYYTPENQSRHHSRSSINTTQKECWLKESFKLTNECSPCTKFQLVSKHLDACVRTGFKESGVCEKSGIEFERSCDKTPWVEERNFWIFESIITMIGIASSLIVKVRQKHLDKKYLERIQKQVAAGV